jgi:putative transcriptional regulator
LHVQHFGRSCLTTSNSAKNVAFSAIELEVVAQRVSSNVIQIDLFLERRASRVSVNRFQNTGLDLKGYLLIASARMADTPLAKTVVLVLQHDTTGSFGVVLNRPANETMRAAWQKASGRTTDVGSHLLQGGPMGGPVFAIHPFEKLGELQVDGGIFLSATVESIDRIVDCGDENYRICLGVVGWRRGFVEQELVEGNWYRLPGDSNLVFDDSGFLWEKSLLSYGRQIMCDMLAINDLPPNPERN